VDRLAGVAQGRGHWCAKASGPQLGVRARRVRNLRAGLGRQPPPLPRLKPPWFGVVIVLAVLMAWLILLPLKLWLMAYMSNANISLLDVIGMTFRKVNRKEIVYAKIMAAQAGLEIDNEAPCTDTAISTSKLEAHYLAGGDVKNVIMALIHAQRENEPLDFPTACAIDLSGQNVLGEIRRRVDSRKPVP